MGYENHRARRLTARACYRARMNAVCISWQLGERQLIALEPTAAELAHHAPTLAAAYNDPRNAPLLGHTEDLDADDVCDHYAELADEGARQFLLFVDGELAGDADLRGLVRGAGEADAGAAADAVDAADAAHAQGGTAEFAFLIGAPAAQGQGLGTRFALMLHAFGFAPPPLGLALDTIYASVVPANTASRRVFAKLGYAEDASAAARAYADDPGDLVLGLDRTVFTVRHPDSVAAIAVAAR